MSLHKVQLALMVETMPPVPPCLPLVPEVSQEGLLRPYASYSDVTLLHYHLPQQLASATWEFAAFMDDADCPVREVHV